MERVGTVARLGLTPLKGAAHWHPDRIAVRRDEVVGDRRWALIQPLRSGWRIVRTVESPGMTAVRARADASGVLRMELPDGRLFLIDGAEGAAVIAEYWGRPANVHLAPGPWDAALSELLGRGVHLVSVDRAGAVVFAEPVSIVTTSSVREVARRAGVGGRDGDGGGSDGGGGGGGGGSGGGGVGDRGCGLDDGGVDDERFRSTMVIDTDGLPAFAEDAWVGGRLRVGAVELIVRQRLARCGVIRIRPGTGSVGGPDPLRLLVADRVVAGEVVFGLGADVEAPGEIAVGDPVSLALR